MKGKVNPLIRIAVMAVIQRLFGESVFGLSANGRTSGSKNLKRVRIKKKGSIEAKAASMAIRPSISFIMKIWLVAAISVLTFKAVLNQSMAAVMALPSYVTRR